jgi:SAM-dependent methyltransferase
LETGTEAQVEAEAVAERLRRGSSFGAAAAQYAQHRPGYAEAAIRWCLEPVGGAQPVRVADVGAGTGILTGELARLGADVVAVEPDPGMLAELRRQLPGARALEGSAEAIPLPDQSVDAVLCGQSMHWFDLGRALPEIGRVLRPGGVLAGLWNVDDDRVDWVVGFAEITKSGSTLSLWRETPKVGGGYHTLEVGSEWFAPVEVREFGNGQSRTADSLVAVTATTSRFLLMEEPERSTTLAGIRDFLGRQPETSVGEFTFPLVTGVLRAVRRPLADARS